MENLILPIAITAIVVAAIFFFIARLFFEKQIVLLKANLNMRDQLNNENNGKITVLLKEKEELISRAVKAEMLLQSSNELLEKAKADAERISTQLKLEMAELSQKILQENANELSKKNQEKINEILKPLQNDLTDFKKKVEDTYDKESKERFSLAKEIDRLVKMSEQVSQEANNLTTALKGNTKMQGNWGEMLLESILENSGLTKGREFQVQEFIKDASENIIKDENGKALQPDVTVYYPDGRKIIIDSKVSLVAWERFVSESEEENKEKILQQHILSIKAHIDGLSRKNYPKYAQALDYVLMFIPVEPAFLEALKKEKLLWKYAYDKKILLVSPTNLLAVLKIIADLWKVEKQNKNALEIAEKAGMLYDKFVGFLESLELVGKKIEDARESYLKAYGQLSAGRGNIIGKIEELKKMGANAQKQIPDKVFYELKM